MKQCSGINKNGERCKVMLKTGAINTKVYCRRHRDQDEGHLAEIPETEQLTLLNPDMLDNMDAKRYVERARQLINSGTQEWVTMPMYTCFRCGSPMKWSKYITTCTNDNCRQEAIGMVKSLVTLTGHRENKLRGAGKEIRNTLQFIFQGLKNQYGTHAILGGAAGADTHAAAAALRVTMPYYLYLPAGYEDNYFKPGTSARKSFDAMYGLRAGERRIGELPFNWRNNFVRNEAMVADTLKSEYPFFIAVSLEDPRTVITNNAKGGTNHGIRTMYKMGVKELMWINPEHPEAFEQVRF